MSSSRRILAVLSAALLLSVLSPATGAHGATDADLRATLQLPEGEIDFELETDVLQSFDEGGAPFVIQVIDGCAVNGYYWVFAAGLGLASVPLTIFDERSGRSHRTVVPAYVPGEPIDTVFDPEALAICREGPSGGIPEIGGTARYTSVTPACRDGGETIVLLSGGREDRISSVLRGESERDTVIARRPVATRDESDEWDELFLFAEGRTPRSIEGVRFSGEEGMLPRDASLARALRDITPGRVRRAYEAAKAQQIPDQLIADLGLRDVGCVFHVSLAFDTLGADAYLAQAGWIREGGPALQPPQPVAPRFDVTLRRADGTSESLPLTGPVQGSDAEGALWEHAADDAKVVVIDGCELSGTFWTLAAAVTDEPLELVVTDTQTGASATHVLWTDRVPTSRLADTAALACS